jgi:hypothetical protein
MATVLKHALCTSCRHRHHFTLAAGELNADRQYTYRCPETGQAAQLQPDGGGEVVHAPPQGAVLLLPAADGTAPWDTHGGFPRQLDA